MSGAATRGEGIERAREPGSGEAASREQLIALLGEAAEIEHCLMCCYLYAAFGIKDGGDADVTTDQVEALERWRRTVIVVAVEEMGHLALVSNLILSLGGTPHFARANFPIGAGLLPASMTVRLSPFDMDTLDHFIFLERPDGADVDDSPRFDVGRDYERGPVEQNVLMPVARDYATVGDFYAQIVEFLDTLAERHGEARLFVGDPSCQVGPEITPLPGLLRVSSLADAKRAIETIVEQGEGAPSDRDDSHFARFAAVKREYEALIDADPDFRPSRPVAENPVMRRPPSPDGKVWITEPDAARISDWVNALYVHMLRLLAQAFGRPGDGAEKRLLIDAATDLMHAVTPAARALTRLPANDTDGVNAGMSFAMTRSTATLPRESDLAVLRERFGEFRSVGDALGDLGPEMARSIETVAHIARTFGARIDGLGTRAADAAEEALDGRAGATDEGDSEVGTHGTLSFDTGRCIHARFCVTGAPKTFLSGVEGQWLFPDEADPDELVAITERCPSGAVRFARTDGGRDEAVPPVNLMRVRENGPLAVHAELVVDGLADGYRRTLCRCGRSGSKPYCDGSHATGSSPRASPRRGTSTRCPCGTARSRWSPCRTGPCGCRVRWSCARVPDARSPGPER